MNPFRIRQAQHHSPSEEVVSDCHRDLIIARLRGNVKDHSLASIARRDIFSPLPTQRNCCQHTPASHSLIPTDRLRRQTIHCIGVITRFAKVPGPCSRRPPFIASPSNLPTSSVGDVASFTKTFIRRPDTTTLMWFHFFDFCFCSVLPSSRLYYSDGTGDNSHSNAQPPLYSVTATSSSLSPGLRWIWISSLRPNVPSESSLRYDRAFLPEKIGCRFR